MSENKLFAVLLGGKIRKNNLMEDHKLVFVVAENEVDAAISARKKWDIKKSHIDGIQKLDNVDGYNIKLDKQA